MHHLGPVHVPSQKYSPSEMFTPLARAAVPVLLNQTGPGAVLCLCGSKRHRLISCVTLSSDSLLGFVDAPTDRRHKHGIPTLSLLCLALNPEALQPTVVMIS